MLDYNFNCKCPSIRFRQYLIQSQSPFRQYLINYTLVQTRHNRKRQLRDMKLWLGRRETASVNPSGGAPQSDRSQILLPSYSCTYLAKGYYKVLLPLPKYSWELYCCLFRIKKETFVRLFTNVQYFKHNN